MAGYTQPAEPVCMIAPCGINCSLCLAHLRQKNYCPGCQGSDDQKPHHCQTCAIKHCPEQQGTDPLFCFSCIRFPCQRLKQFDKRYRLRYGLSPIEDLQRVQEVGLPAFLATESPKWLCKKCGGQLCMHRDTCPSCGDVRQIIPLPLRPRARKTKG